MKAVLFDLDGTLVDSVPDIAVAVDGMLKQLGRAPAGEARVRGWVGNGGRMLVRRALAGNVTGVADDDPQLASAMDIFFACYDASNGRASRLYDGVTDALEELSVRGLPMAVITNKPHRYIEPLFDALGITRHFRILIGGDTLPVKKPDPAPLLLACRELGIAPADALMVGDSRNDIEAARAAGCPVVAVDYGYNYGRPIADDGPDRVIGNLLQLLVPAGSAPG
ncbi:MAG: phosphoglycolate phosphatase [Pseudomonadota bacterium]